MSKFKVTDHVRVTHPNPLWFDMVGEVIEVDMLGGLYEFHVKIPGQASTWFNDDELILAESAPRKDMAEQEIDGERVRGASNSVSHPAHYTSHPSGIECIQITEHMGFNLGNALKYIWRCDLKLDAIEDLEKARWYIERELAKRKAAQ